MLITQLRAKEAEAAQAANDLAKVSEADLTARILLAEAEQAAADAKAADDATAADLEAKALEARAAAHTAGNAHAAKAVEVQDRMQRVAEWREFVREPLRRTREEMRTRGTLLPDLPADIELGEDDG